MKRLFVTLMCLLLLNACVNAPVRPVSAKKNKAHFERDNLKDEFFSIISDLRFRHIKPLYLNDDYSSVLFDLLTGFGTEYYFALDHDLKVEMEAKRYLLDSYIGSNDIEVFFKIHSTVMQSKLIGFYWCLNQIAASSTFVQYAREVENSPYLRQGWLSYLERKKRTYQEMGLSQKGMISAMYTYFNREIEKIESMNDFMVFESFVNVIIKVHDPQSAYLLRSKFKFSDVEVDNLNDLVGIGLMLQKKSDFTEVVRVVSGAPGELSGIKPGDKIVAFLNKSDGLLINLIGLELDDVTRLLRGKKGTELIVYIVKDGMSLNDKPIEVSVIRDHVTLEVAKVAGRVVTLKGDAGDISIGVIEIPYFYQDFHAVRRGDPRAERTFKDLKLIFKDFDSRGVKGVVIDLRQSVGGAFREVIDSLGLILSTTPVLQIKTREKVYAQNIRSLHSYEAPIVLLINRSTSSGSEAFAAALMDHKRAIIVGERSAGFGTIQSMEIKGAGFLKVSTSAMYRVNGKSLHGLGVVPDISLVYLDEKRDQLEKMDIPISPISAIDLSIDTSLDLSDLRKLSKRRFVDSGVQEKVGLLKGNNRSVEKLNGIVKNTDYQVDNESSFDKAIQNLWLQEALLIVKDQIEMSN